MGKLAADPVAPGRLETGFAKACNMSEAEVCAYAHLWEAKQLHAGAKEWSAHCKSAVVNLAVAMLKHEHPEKWEALAKPLEVLATLRPPVKGVVLSTPGVVEVPPMLRSRVVALLEVSMRVLGYKEPV